MFDKVISVFSGVCCWTIHSSQLLWVCYVVMLTNVLLCCTWALIFAGLWTVAANVTSLYAVVAERVNVASYFQHTGLTGSIFRQGVWKQIALLWFLQQVGIFDPFRKQCQTSEHIKYQEHHKQPTQVEAACNTLYRTHSWLCIKARLLKCQCLLHALSWILCIPSQVQHIKYFDTGFCNWSYLSSYLLIV